MAQEDQAPAQATESAEEAGLGLSESEIWLALASSANCHDSNRASYTKICEKGDWYVRRLARRFAGSVADLTLVGAPKCGDRARLGMQMQDLQIRCGFCLRMALNEFR